MFRSKFDVKDRVIANAIHGFKITRTLDDVILSQTHYMVKILKIEGRVLYKWNFQE